jgi:hypothetical protein
MSDLEISITRVADFIKRYKCIGSICFRFTLGKYTHFYGFEKHLFQEEKYNDILNLLNKCSSWDSEIKKDYGKINCESEKIVDTLIIKCENGPYDIILTAETVKTTPLFIPGEFEINENIYKKKNHTFILSKGVSNLNEIVYCASIIADIPKGYTDSYISHSSILKICDLISVCNDKKEQLVLKILQKNNQLK